ncbi:pentatricopeptide repeat-containing protein [Salix suchowensis]|nr:pentatricopeptide repeat-containing protein [Salix suchowensis]
MEEAGCHPNVVTYNVLIDGLCKDRRVNEALDIFSYMKAKRISPDIFTYNSLIQGLCNFRRWKEASALLNEMMSLNIMPNIAFRLFRVMQSTYLKPDVVMYNILIDAMCEFGNLKDARKLFSELSFQGLLPNVQIYTTIINGLYEFSYNVIIRGFLQHKDESTAAQLIGEMRDRGFVAEVGTATW